jgi:hypothetical protein
MHRQRDTRDGAEPRTARAGRQGSSVDSLHQRDSVAQNRTRPESRKFAAT